jgi:L-fuculose-phosphate aldolase
MSLVSSWIGGTRRLVADVGRHGLLFGPVRRAFVEPAATASDELLRLMLSYYGQRLWHSGFIAGSAGNLSARLKTQDAIYISTHATSMASLRRSDITRVSLSGDEPVPENVSVELPLHRACYLADEHLGAVIHTHAPALTALSVLGIDLCDFLPEVRPSLGSVALVPHAPAGSDELARSVVGAVESGAGLVLLERHGAVTVGSDLSEACDRMELGELSATAVLMARDGG